MADKPVSYPVFASEDIVGPSGQPNVSPPPLSLQNEGWQYLSPIARQYMNWLHRLYDQWIQWFDQEVTQNSNDISNNTSNISSLNGRVSTNENDIDSIDARLTTAEGTIVTHTSVLSTHTSQIGTLNTDLTNLGYRVNDTEADISSLQAFDVQLKYVANGGFNYRLLGLPAYFATMYYTRIGRIATIYIRQLNIPSFTSGQVALEPFSGGGSIPYPDSILPVEYPSTIPCVLDIDGDKKAAIFKFNTAALAYIHWLDNGTFNDIIPSCNLTIPPQNVTYYTQVVP